MVGSWVSYMVIIALKHMSMPAIARQANAWNPSNIDEWKRKATLQAYKAIFKHTQTMNDGFKFTGLNPDPRYAIGKENYEETQLPPLDGKTLVLLIFRGKATMIGDRYNFVVPMNELTIYYKERIESELEKNETWETKLKVRRNLIATDVILPWWTSGFAPEAFANEDQRTTAYRNFRDSFTPDIFKGTPRFDAVFPVYNRSFIARRGSWPEADQNLFDFVARFIQTVASRQAAVDHLARAASHPESGFFRRQTGRLLNVE